MSGFRATRRCFSSGTKNGLGAFLGALSAGCTKSALSPNKLAKIVGPLLAPFDCSPMPAGGGRISANRVSRYRAASASRERRPSENGGSRTGEQLARAWRRPHAHRADRSRGGASQRAPARSMTCLAPLRARSSKPIKVSSPDRSAAVALARAFAACIALA